MSSRHLKKVFGSEQDDLFLKNNEEDDDDEPIAQNTRTTNFALLNRFADHTSENGQGDDADSAEDSDTGKNRLTNNDNEADGDGSGSTSGQANKKKRKRKKKKKTAVKVEVNVNNQLEAGPECEPSTSTSNASDEGIDRRRRSIGNNKPPKSYSRDANETSKIAELEKLLTLESRCLNPQMELKRIFGVNTVNSGGRGGKFSQRRVTRLCRLVSQKDHWTPTAGSGISMSFVETINGAQHFKFNHSDAYREVQRRFMSAVDSLNPDNIVSILTACPYHVDSRIQLSDLAKNAEDVQIAADLVEGAIHCMESSFDSRFSLTNTSCRLEYKYQENRAFHILLFKHLLFVGQRACYRTALELCKRLLLLDPVGSMGDPLAVTLMIDFYAIKAGESQFLINLYDFWEPIRNLSQLPNWAYSVALAKFLLSKKKNGSSSKGRKGLEKKLTEETTEFVDPSSISAAADELLQYAILMFPHVLLPLLDKCQVHVESRVQAHQYFNKFNTISAKGVSPLKQLCDLYVWRSHHVWKDKDVIGWVERNVNAALVKVDGKDPIIADYANKRQRRYGGTPRNILRHLLLIDNKDFMGHISAQIKGDQILNYDPLPPRDAIDIYTRVPVLPENLQGHGLLGSLFASVFSDLNAQRRQQQQQPFDQEIQRHLQGAVGGQVEEPQPGPANPFTQSVATLLDSMRDLLIHIRPPGAQGPEEGDDDGDDDDDGQID